MKIYDFTNRKREFGRVVFSLTLDKKRMTERVIIGTADEVRQCLEYGRGEGDVYYDETRTLGSLFAKLRAEYDELSSNTGSHEWIEQFKKHRDITVLTRPVAVTLLDRIVVYQDKRIEVLFKYNHKYQRIIEYIQSVQAAQPEHDVDVREVV